MGSFQGRNLASTGKRSYSFKYSGSGLFEIYILGIWRQPKTCPLIFIILVQHVIWEQGVEEIREWEEKKH